MGASPPGHRQPAAEARAEEDRATRWQRLKGILADALERPAAQQQDFIAQRAGDSAELAELQALLAAGQAGQGLLDHGSAALAQQAVQARLGPSWIGRCLGRYRLVELIARGGMGQVYKAEVTDGSMAQPVAIKLMKDGCADEVMARRFQAERDTLARLEHPHLARLLDGGVVDGVPYLVMELVVGEPIDAYCSRRALGWQDRLRLFQCLCDVVDYAHRQNIVHRDLKAANVLVTQAGIVKLLDFGIAKQLADEARHARTATAMRVMSLACASPEQVRGEPITPASDIYSLGVLLYELLCGASPHARALEGTDLDLRNAICHGKPIPPSRLPGALHRSAPSRVRTGLDAVVMKALRKKPGQRHESAMALSAAVARCLAGQRPQPRWSALRRLSRAQGMPAWVLAACALVLPVCLGTTAYALHRSHGLALQAHEHLVDLRAWIDDAMTHMDALQDQPAATQTRRQLVRQALDQLQRLRPRADDDPALGVELARAFRRVGQAQGTPPGAGVFSLGDLDGAAASHAAAIRLLEQALRQQPGAELRQAARLELAQARGGIAVLHALQGRSAEAVVDAEQAVAGARQAATSNQAGPAARAALAKTQLPEISALLAAGRETELDPALQAAQAALDHWRADSPAEPQALRLTAMLHGLRADRLLRMNVETPQSATAAAQALQSGIAVLEQLRRREPQARELMALTASFQHRLGEALRKSQDLAEASAIGQQAHQLASQLRLAEPDNPSLQALQADAAFSLVQTQLVAGHAEAAVQTASAAVRALPTDPPASGSRIGLLQRGEAHRLFAQALLARAMLLPEAADGRMPADWLVACEHFRHGLQLLTPLSPRWKGDTWVNDGARLFEMRQVLRTCPPAA